MVLFFRNCDWSIRFPEEKKEKEQDREGQDEACEEGLICVFFGEKMRWGSAEGMGSEFHNCRP